MNIRTCFYWGTLFLFLLTSCHSTPDSVYHTLTQVEACLENHPDSALYLLEHISNSKNLHGEAQANYCLLMTIAMNKNYMKIHSDSLISIAVAYYGVQGVDRVKKGESFFYYGRVLLGLDRLEEAMQYCLDAERILEDGKEYKLLGLLYEDMGNINWRMELYEQALHNYRESKKYYEKAHEYTGVSIELRNIGRIHLMMNQDPDSAYWYHTEALNLARRYHCNSEFSILQGLGVIFRQQKKHEKSISYLLQALQLDVKKESIAEINFSIGHTYLQMGDLVHAEKFLKQSLDSSNNTVRTDAYTCLYKLEKAKSNFKEAIYYKEISDSIRKMIQGKENLSTIANLQKKYENEKLKNENLQMKYGQGVVLGVCALLSSVIVILLFYYRYKSREAKKRIQEIGQTILVNEEQITGYRHEISRYKLLQDESEEYRNKVADLNGRVLVLVSQNKDLQEQLTILDGKEKMKIVKLPVPVMAEDPMTHSLSLMHALKNGTKRELGDDEWSGLFGLLNYLYNDFVTRLRNEYPVLTMHDIKICCLLKISMSHEDISRVFSTAPDSLTKAKGRMKKKLGLSSAENLYEFVVKF